MVIGTEIVPTVAQCSGGGIAYHACSRLVRRVHNGLSVVGLVAFLADHGQGRGVLPIGAGGDVGGERGGRIQVAQFSYDGSLCRGVGKLVTGQAACDGGLGGEARNATNRYPITGGRDVVVGRAVGDGQPLETVAYDASGSVRTLDAAAEQTALDGGGGIACPHNASGD